jgi:hypothetical protein
MTRKDYEFIARVIQNLPSRASKQKIIKQFSLELALQSDKFNQLKFQAACK